MKKLGPLAAEYARILGAKRLALVQLANGLADEIADIRSDRFLPEYEKERQIVEARDRVDRNIAAAVEEAEEALEEASNFARKALDGIEISDGARARAVRLLDAGIGPADVIERARTLGDTDTLAALRQELHWRVAEGRLGDALSSESETAAQAVETAIAESLRGNGGEELGALLGMARSPGIPEARRLAVATVEGKAGQAQQARLAYHFATTGTEPSAAAAGDGSGEGGGAE